MRLRPKNAVTRFYGIANVKGQTLALHLYDLPAVPKGAKLPGPQQRRLDVLRLTQGHKTTFYKRLHAIQLAPGWKAWGSPLQIVFQMATMWLDPDSQRQPILLLRSLNRLS